MMEELDMVLEMAQENMQKSVTHLEQELIKIRAGRANPNMLDGVRVEYYGSVTPLNQLSNINAPDARTLTIQPWDKSMIPDIEKAIMNANLGLNPQNNGEAVILNIPALTEERRKDLVKRTRAEAEEARISIRNARKEANDEIKKLDGLSEDEVKDAEDRVQSLTNKHIQKVDEVLEHKEADIMKV
ncbi:MAG: ribosome recycling factor [Schleiferiaceae bacterium]|nr:ribosome recycling factor [Schleiferiaceae bacterium]MDR9442209.1 ribosome recycling factor [Schleiferiaceae bacterium]